MRMSKDVRLTGEVPGFEDAAADMEPKCALLQARPEDMLEVL